MDQAKRRMLRCARVKGACGRFLCVKGVRVSVRVCAACLQSSTLVSSACVQLTAVRRSQVSHSQSPISGLNLFSRRPPPYPGQRYLVHHCACACAPLRRQGGGKRDGQAQLDAVRASSPLPNNRQPLRVFNFTLYAPLPHTHLMPQVHPCVCCTRVLGHKVPLFAVAALGALSARGGVVDGQVQPHVRARRRGRQPSPHRRARWGAPLRTKQVARRHRVRPGHTTRLQKKRTDKRGALSFLVRELACLPLFASPTLAISRSIVLPCSVPTAATRLTGSTPLSTGQS